MLALRIHALVHPPRTYHSADNEIRLVQGLRAYFTLGVPKCHSRLASGFTPAPTPQLFDMIVHLSHSAAIEGAAPIANGCKKGQRRKAQNAHSDSMVIYSTSNVSDTSCRMTYTMRRMTGYDVQTLPVRPRWHQTSPTAIERPARLSALDGWKPNLMDGWMDGWQANCQPPMPPPVTSGRDKHVHKLRNWGCKRDLGPYHQCTLVSP
jgi:hypothetical protein